ncbi:hypothetical protein PoB_001283800 [Plakobranchus ocellatus]|uniref:Uncharacterized protein n=1 Tax=Plakobranchus ocellatus TaxID=259542 RepID=A0AAV3YVR0_9GAST|nr:hypothetical protein PoB_001283800 [Plakobranchus ocellatus]
MYCWIRELLPPVLARPYDDPNMATVSRTVNLTVRLNGHYSEIVDGSGSTSRPVLFTKVFANRHERRLHFQQTFKWRAMLRADTKSSKKKMGEILKWHRRTERRRQSVTPVSTCSARPQQVIQTITE